MKKYSNIRAARRFVAVLLAVGLTLCVGVGARCIFTRMQLVPAVMSCSVLWLALWAAATMAFGRVYCSTACPMGALMDGVERLRMAVEHLRRRRRSRYKFREAGIRGRYSVLFVVVLCMLLGFGVIPSLLDPYSAYARIVSGLRAFVALPAGRAAGIGVLSAAVAFATLAAVAAVSWRRGRYLCNTWCPVGSALSIVSRNSMFHADVNTDLCVRCLRCVDVCKASCINPSDMTIDPARCVVCFNCMDVCVNDAVTYRRGRHTLAMPLMQRAGAAPSAAASMDGCAGAPQRLDRRKFLKLGVVAAAAGVAAVASSASGRRSAAWDPQPLVPLNVPVPPGAPTRRGFLRRCTACGACVSACPTGVIQSSVRAYGLQHAMVPMLDYGRVACSTDCNACTQVCPTGALVPLTLEEKRRYVIGKARVRLQNCLVYWQGRSCGRCARRCPYGAIAMTRFSDGRRGPVVDMDKCVGCGQCEAVCPSSPYKAIVIEGAE